MKRKVWIAIIFVVLAASLSFIYTFELYSISFKPEPCVPVPCEPLPTEKPVVVPDYGPVLKGGLNTTLLPDPSVCVIARTFVGQTKAIPPFVLSLDAPDYKKLKIFLVDTGKEPMGEKLTNLVDACNKMAGRTLVFESNVTHKSSHALFPEFHEENYGYLATDIALEQILEDHDCDYFLFTNGDNLYTRTLFTHTLPYMQSKFDVIGFDFISRYCLGEPNTYTARPGCEVEFFTQLRASEIDLGAALYRTEQLKTLENRFLVDKLRMYTNPLDIESIQGINYWGLDARFMYTAKEAANSFTVIRRVLFVHQ